jgi:hypothetical protein
MQVYTANLKEHRKWTFYCLWWVKMCVFITTVEWKNSYRNSSPMTEMEKQAVPRTPSHLQHGGCNISFSWIQTSQQPCTDTGGQVYLWVLQLSLPIIISLILHILKSLPLSEICCRPANQPARISLQYLSVMQLQLRLCSWEVSERKS